jgi:hypothetical protein
MDIPVIRAFYVRAVELGGDPSELQWGRAVLEALVATELDADTRAALRRSVEADPGQLCRVADWVFLGLLPAQEIELALETALEVGAFETDSPESRNAQKRLLRWREGALPKRR